MNGIVSGKSEKSNGSLIWKTVKNLTSLAENKSQITYTNQTDLSNATHLKLVSELEGDRHTTIFSLSDIKPQTYGYSLYYPAFSALNLCFTGVSTGLDIQTKESRDKISDMLVDIELGVLE